MTEIRDLSSHPDAYITVQELAAFWNVSDDTIYRDIKKGALRVSYVGSAGLIRIAKHDAVTYGRPST